MINKMMLSNVKLEKIIYCVVVSLMVRPYIPLTNKKKLKLMKRKTIQLRLHTIFTEGQLLWFHFSSICSNECNKSCFVIPSPIMTKFLGIFICSGINNGIP
jgi:hypothetical protein